LAGDRAKVVEPSPALAALVETPAAELLETNLFDVKPIVDAESIASAAEILIEAIPTEAPTEEIAREAFLAANAEQLVDADFPSEVDFSLLENIFDKDIAVLLGDTETGSLEAEEMVESNLEIALEPELIPTEAIDADYTDYTDYVDYTENTLTATASSLVPSQRNESIQLREPLDLSYPREKSDSDQSQREPLVNPSLTVRVDADRLERMNSLVGELAISHNGVCLQNDQLQSVIRELLSRFSRFQTLAGQLQQLSDQMLVAPERSKTGAGFSLKSGNGSLGSLDNPPLYLSSYLSTVASAIEFDSLEMDTYGALHFQLQGILEEIVQLEEAVEDIAFFAKQSHQMLHQQRPMLTQLQDEVTWSRMVPIGEVLNRFPRMLRDLSATYHKPVNLNLIGTEVLVDKAILEKLYDPLLHLVRNAFDHGIEPPAVRRQRGKPEQGEIEIRTYHRGNQTVIEVKDDGQGLNLDRIRERIFELGWMSANQLMISPPAQLFEYIFEPGFSTAHQVSKLSGRGVGLDVVRSQLQAVKGTVTVESLSGKGTTFTLRLPLMLTIAKLIICNVNSAFIALSVDSVAEILTPKLDQIRQSGSQRFLYWQEQIIPIYRLAERLDYRCPLPEASSSSTLGTISAPSDWAAPMLIFRKEEQVFALEVNQVITEQELVIKPFSATIAPPSYTYGCTILADGKLVPVIDVVALLSSESDPVTEPITPRENAAQPSYAFVQLPPQAAAAAFQTVQPATVLVVDDAATLRRSLALSLERAGFRVVQARDGREAIDQLQQRSSIRLIVCDIEMPNMNGFEFLNYRRQDPQLSKLPVVILTSRSNEKHRWLAMQLGATAYFTKPYLEQEFLEAIGNLIQ
jgi:chemotaxis family two-component system sensor histidine kinase/response regulator PixL